MRLVIIFLLMPLVACTRLADPADMVLIGGRIYTVDSNRSWAEAVAIRNNAIMAVGTDNQIAQYRGGTTEVIDLAGRMVLPGFHDSHSHPLEGGYLMRYCDLSKDGTDVDTIIDLISLCVAQSDEQWIIGFGLDLALFGSNGPDKSLLDDIAPDRFFFIDAVDGHSTLVNSKTLELAGINADSKDPEHGVIERRSGKREPNGTLRESARDLVDRLRPKRQLEESVEAMADAMKSMNAVGITSVVDAWAGELEYQVYQALDQSGSLTVRVTNSLIDEGVFGKHFGADFERVLSKRHEYASTLINNNSIKLMIDGVFEGETAALTKPYEKLGHSGTLNHTTDELKRRVARYDAMGLQVHLHSMGDGAVRAGLDAIEHARKKNTQASFKPRHHLSHLGLINPVDIPRFAELDAAANFTAAWAYPSDWDLKLNLPTLGRERVNSMYPINSVHTSGGVVVVGGSDWIYGPLDPLASM